MLNDRKAERRRGTEDLQESLFPQSARRRNVVSNLHGTFVMAETVTPTDCFDRLESELLDVELPAPHDRSVDQ